MVLIFCIGILAVAIGFFENYRGELDITSFLFASVSKIIIRRPHYPKSDFSDVEVWRKALKFISIPSNYLHFDNHVTTFDVKYSEASEGLHLRIFRHDHNEDPLSKVIIWIHGGAFTFGSIAADNFLCMDLAKAANAIVVSIEYRLMPEGRFPAPIEDCTEALEWVHYHINYYGGDPNKIFLMGESAGGNIAAALTARNFDHRFVPESEQINILGVVLAYPALDIGGHWPSYDTYGEVNGIVPGTQADFIAEQYAGGKEYLQELRQNYLFSPINIPAELLQFFPPVVLIQAKYDIFLDEGLAFAQKLREHGRTVDVTVYNSTIHYFFGKHMFWHGHEALLEAGRKIDHIAHEYEWQLQKQRDAAEE